VPWLVGSAPAVYGCGWFLVPVLSGWSGWPTPVHGFGVRERHDEASLVRNGLGRPLWVARGSRGVDGVHTSLGRVAQKEGVYCQVRAHDFLVPVPEKGQTQAAL
jgi:hypothetical protein